METNLRLAVLSVALIIVLVNLQLLRKGRIPIKFSLLWLFISIVLFFVTFFPDFLIMIMKFLGFQTLSNMVVGILFIVLFFITIVLTIIASGQTAKINLLIQELSIVKEKVSNYEKSKSNDD